MFGTKGHSESTMVNKYIRPGINHEVVIESVKGVEETKCYIEFLFRLPNAKAEEGSRQRFYMHTDGAVALNTSRIKHIATKVVKEEQVDAISANNILEYGMKLNSLLAGKTLRVKFAGEEYLATDGTGAIKVRSVLPVQNFAEAINMGAEHEPVSKENTKLKYDEKSQYDFKRMAVMPTSDTIVDDDLPF